MKTIICLCLLLYLASTDNVSAQVSKQKTPVIPQQGISWLTDTWSGNDLPFKRSRIEIDKASHSKQLTAAALKTYQALAEKEPENAQAVFNWAYANYIAEKDPAVQGNIVVSSGVFAYAASPKTYNYTRIRFLIATRDKPSPQLYSLGERLLRKNNQDYDVQYSLVQCLALAVSKSEMKRAVLLAKSLIRSYPTKPSAYASLGGIYFNAWYTRRNPLDGVAAVTAYQKYLQFAPANDPWRPQAQIMISYIKTQKSH